MPYGKGSYGSKVGRPSKKDKQAEKSSHEKDGKEKDRLKKRPWFV